MADLIVIVSFAIVNRGHILMLKASLGHRDSHDLKCPILFGEVNLNLHAIQLGMQPKAAILIDRQREGVFPGIHALL
ncbi:hypothetical protein [Novosphingobium sp. Gsoil 351]|uniref:hypothetical protein n=1 Tax=Novosphingobium sp. Gsoil 351 TaxID=2675225 RepID=UPI0012B447C6|nr:hypothetical protein [Novosphingobium sp. Gsoil 351]QGN55522.1 hypothetical protein GKE62_14130 [Novosphingobium sp. Gsoil 351]